MLHNAEEKLRIDAVLFGEDDLLLFSFARAYFMVDMEIPSAYVQFLHHQRHSTDKFRIAPGIKDYYPPQKDTTREVFPETFAPFLLGNPAVRAVFMKHHADLLEASFWERHQTRIVQGYVHDVFPYEQVKRFRRTPLDRG